MMFSAQTLSKSLLLLHIMKYGKN